MKKIIALLFCATIIASVCLARVSNPGAGVTVIGADPLAIYRNNTQPPTTDIGWAGFNLSGIGDFTATNMFMLGNFDGMQGAPGTVSFDSVNAFANHVMGFFQNAGSSINITNGQGNYIGTSLGGDIKLDVAVGNVLLTTGVGQDIYLVGSGGGVFGLEMISGTFSNTGDGVVVAATITSGMVLTTGDGSMTAVNGPATNAMPGSLLVGGGVSQAAGAVTTTNGYWEKVGSAYQKHMTADAVTNLLAGYIQMTNSTHVALVPSANDLNLTFGSLTELWDQWICYVSNGILFESRFGTIELKSELNMELLPGDPNNIDLYLGDQGGGDDWQNIFMAASTLIQLDTPVVRPDSSNGTDIGTSALPFGTMYAADFDAIGSSYKINGVTIIGTNSSGTVVIGSNVTYEATARGQLYLDGVSTQNLTATYQAMSNMTVYTAQGVTATASSITPDKTADYDVYYQISAELGNNEAIEVAIFAGATEQNQIESHTATPATGADHVTSSGCGMITNLAAGTPVTLRVKSLDAAASFIKNKIQLKMKEIR